VSGKRRRNGQPVDDIRIRIRKALLEMKSGEKASLEMKSGEKALLEMKSDEKLCWRWRMMKSFVCWIKPARKGSGLTKPQPKPSPEPSPAL
jgi:hypothetical protein